VDVITPRRSRSSASRACSSSSTPRRLPGSRRLDGLKEWLRKRAKAFTHQARDFASPSRRGSCSSASRLREVAPRKGGSLWKLPLLLSTWGSASALSSAPSEETSGRHQDGRVGRSLHPLARRAREGLAGTQKLGAVGRRDDGARLRHVHHLAPGEEVGRLRHRHGQLGAPAPARAPAKGPLRRDLLSSTSPSAASGRRSSTSTSSSGSASRHFDRDALIEARTASRARRSSRRSSPRSTTPRQGRGPDGRVPPARPRGDVPLSTTMQEEINAMREWSKQRAAPRLGGGCASPSART